METIKNFIVEAHSNTNYLILIYLCLFYILRSLSVFNKKKWIANLLAVTLTLSLKYTSDEQVVLPQKNIKQSETQGVKTKERVIIKDKSREVGLVKYDFKEYSSKELVEKTNKKYRPDFNEKWDSGDISREKWDPTVAGPILDYETTLESSKYPTILDGTIVRCFVDNKKVCLNKKYQPSEDYTYFKFEIVNGRIDPDKPGPIPFDLVKVKKHYDEILKEYFKVKKWNWENTGTYDFESVEVEDIKINSSYCTTQVENCIKSEAHLCYVADSEDLLEYMTPEEIINYLTSLDYPLTKKEYDQLLIRLKNLFVFFKPV